MLHQKSRIYQLNLLLQYDTEKGGIFTKGERICLNQERAYLLQFNTPQPTIIKVFEYNKQLQNKIENTLNKIEFTNWLPYQSIDIDWSINDV